MQLDELIENEYIKKMLSQLRKLVDENIDLKQRIADTADILYKKKDSDGFVKQCNINKKELSEELGDLTNVLSLLCFEQGLDTLVESQRKRGISAQQTKESFYDLNLWINNFYTEHQNHGFAREAWLVRHFSGVYYRVGKLQYEIQKYQNETNVYKYGEKVVVTAKEGLKIDRSGDITYNQPVATTFFSEGKNELFAHVVDHGTGMISPEPRRIDLTKYKKVLSCNDYVLNVHIPTNEPLISDECDKSFEDALAFFKEHFPEYNFKAFTAYSWLLSNEINGIIKENSNISRFSKRFIRNIHKVQQEYFYQWIFGFDVKNYDEITPKTSLQKGVLELNQKGIDIYSRGGFILI